MTVCFSIEIYGGKKNSVACVNWPLMCLLTKRGVVQSCHNPSGQMCNKVGQAPGCLWGNVEMVFFSIPMQNPSKQLFCNSNAFAVHFCFNRLSLNMEWKNFIPVNYLLVYECKFFQDNVAKILMNCCSLFEKKNSMPPFPRGLRWLTRCQWSQNT